MLQRSYNDKIPQWKTWLAGWQQLDFVLLFLVVCLTAFGGLMIQSTELRQETVRWFWLYHWILGAIGLFVALFIARFRYEFLIQWHWMIYGLTNLSLIAIKFFGVEINGSTRWLSILGIQFQPSEFAKLGLIITMAALLHARPATSIPSILRTLAITIVPWALVFAQPDLGTSLVFGAITLGMLYWANANPGWLILMVSCLPSAILFNVHRPAWYGWLGAMGIIAWFTLPWRRIGTAIAIFANTVAGGASGYLWNELLKEYQKDRLILFLQPEKDPLGGGYHLIQSRIAIGAGEMWGKGLQNGTQTQLNFIPEQHTDFIFSAVGEELGFVGCIGLLIVFWLICLRLIMIAQNANENFGSLLAVGVLSMVIFQVFVNISMTIGLAPITGIPLPWMSYGRSALLTNFLAIGLVESVANNRPRLHFRRGEW